MTRPKAADVGSPPPVSEDESDQPHAPRRARRRRSRVPGVSPRPSNAARPDLTAVAHHEAGHWVVARLLGSNVGMIEVGWDHVTESWGRTARGDIPDLYLKSHQIRTVEEALGDPGYRDAVERQATLTLAGPAAEAQYLNRRALRGARTDLVQARLLLVPFNNHQRAFDAHLRRIRRRARILVRATENWIAIMAVAQAVGRRKHLDLAQAIRIADTARVS